MKKIILFTCLSIYFSVQVNAQEKWISLFDGKTTNGWHKYGTTTVGAGWKVADNTLTLDPTAKDGGDLVTNDSFDDFHLQMEWKISKNGNSGIIFFIQDNHDKYYHIWYTGPEMQILDNDGHSDGKIYKHRAGNLYDLIAGPEGVVKPVGEWNTVDIINQKGVLTLKMNGVVTVNTVLGDDNWKALIKSSKFSKGESPDFGKIFAGHIGLQDHGNEVSFRNIRIQRL